MNFYNLQGRLFEKLKLKAFLNTEMNDFPTILYTSTCEIPTLFIPEAWKRYPFRAEPLRIGHYKEYPPGGNSNEANLPAQNLFEFLCL